MKPVPYRDTWTAVPGQTEREFRVIRQAHYQPIRMAVPVSRRSVRREILEAFAFLLTLFLVIAVLSLDGIS